MKTPWGRDQQVRHDFSLFLTDDIYLESGLVATVVSCLYDMKSRIIGWLANEKKTTKKCSKNLRYFFCKRFIEMLQKMEMELAIKAFLL